MSKSVPVSGVTAVISIVLGSLLGLYSINPLNVSPSLVRLFSYCISLLKVSPYVISFVQY